jgi:hypothetical protein
MSIEFTCPTCQTQIRVDQAAAGKMARCPKCQGICRVPDGSTPPQGQAPVPTTAAPFAPLTPLGSNDLFGGTGALKQPSPFAPLPSNSPGAASSPPSKNPFGDVGQGSGGGDPLNPYASPAYVSSPQDLGPLSPEDVRMKLLGPAIGIVIGAILCLGYIGLTIIGMLINEEDRIPVVSIVIGIGIATLPSLAMLVGSVAMFRGKGPTLAWTAAIAAVMPCNPCCLISLGFGIWGIVVLCDPRVTHAMRS